MSGVSPSPAEHHLGDRLAALVDGELSHDARERVLAHLATCAKCKAEADAQRRVKTMFVESAPPPLSAGLLARLQGLPEDGPDGPSGPGPSGPFGYVAPTAPQQGFRIHEVGRPRRRFAFVAAGAVSLAAFALGGSLPADGVVDPRMHGEAPATRPGPVAPVSDAVARERVPAPGFTARPLVQPWLSPSPQPVSLRP